MPHSRHLLEREPLAKNGPDGEQPACRRREARKASPLTVLARSNAAPSIPSVDLIANEGWLTEEALRRAAREAYHLGYRQGRPTALTEAYGGNEECLALTVGQAWGNQSRELVSIPPHGTGRSLTTRPLSRASHL